VHTLSRPDQDATASLEKLARALDAEQAEPRRNCSRPSAPAARKAA
jgi:hypothetical protein